MPTCSKGGGREEKRQQTQRHITAYAKATTAIATKLTLKITNTDTGIIMSSISNVSGGSGVEQQEENQVSDDYGALDVCRELRSLDLGKFHMSRLTDVLAITTPIPDQYGNVSTKTPIFHLPMYRLDLFLRYRRGQHQNHDQNESESDDDDDDVDAKLMSFYCDLADLTDFLTKLKELEDEWRRYC